MTNATRQLQEQGQSIWLDNITRTLLTSGTLARYVDQLSVTGLTSNPTIFDKAIEGSDAYDETIGSSAASGEPLLFELALDDLRAAADLFRPVHERTAGMDGWVSLEVSPDLADDATKTVAEAVRLHAQAERPNLFIKIPGTRAGIDAIEEAIFRGVPVNVTLLFSCSQYVAAAEAYLRGIERRIAAGRDPGVHSVASLFVSRWDVAAAEVVSPELRNRLGIAIGTKTYAAYRELLASERWRRLQDAGADPQRLLFASTGTKDPAASDVLYVEALAAELTINTMPDTTLLAFADHGHVRGLLPDDGGDVDETLARFTQAGIDLDALALRLQQEGAAAFSASWAKLLDRIAHIRDLLAAA
jgi:transaldolase